MDSVKPEIIEEAEIPMFELRDEIAKMKKRDTELNFRAGRTEEYLGQFVTIKTKDAKELIEKIRKLDVPRLKDVHIFKLVDIMPQTPDDVKMVLQNYTITVNQDNLKKIANAVKDHVPGLSK